MFNLKIYIMDKKIETQSQQIQSLQTLQADDIDRSFEITPEITNSSTQSSKAQPQKQPSAVQELIQKVLAESSSSSNNVKRKSLTEEQVAILEPKKEFISDLIKFYKMNNMSSKSKDAFNEHIYYFLLNGVQIGDINFEIKRLTTLQQLANQGMLWLFNERENTNNIKILGLIEYDKVKSSNLTVQGADVQISNEDFNREFLNHSQEIRNKFLDFSIKKLTEILKRSDKIEYYPLNCLPIKKNLSLIDNRNLQGCIKQINYLLSNLTNFELRKIVTNYKDLIKSYEFKEFDNNKRFVDIKEIFDGKSIDESKIIEKDFIKLSFNKKDWLYEIDKDLISKDLIEDLYLISVKNKPLISAKHRDHIEGLRLNITNARHNQDLNLIGFDSSKATSNIVVQPEIDDSKSNVEKNILQEKASKSVRLQDKTPISISNSPKLTGVKNLSFSDLSEVLQSSNRGL